MKKDTMYIQVLIFSIADGVYCLEVAPLYMTPEEGSWVHPYIKISLYK